MAVPAWIERWLQREDEALVYEPEPPPVDPPLDDGRVGSVSWCGLRTLADFRPRAARDTWVAPLDASET
jgi:hypothetical protein